MVGSSVTFKSKFSCPALPIHDIKIELIDSGFFSDDKLGGCRIRFPLLILNDTYVDAWYNIYKFKNSKVNGRIHMVIGCVTTCPNMINFYTIHLPYAKNGDIVNEYCWPTTPYVCSGVHFIPQVGHSNYAEEHSLKKIQELFPKIPPDLIKDIYENKARSFEDTVNECMELDKESKQLEVKHTNEANRIQ